MRNVNLRNAGNDDRRRQTDTGRRHPRPVRTGPFLHLSPRPIRAFDADDGRWKRPAFRDWGADRAWKFLRKEFDVDPARKCLPSFDDSATEAGQQKSSLIRPGNFFSAPIPFSRPAPPSAPITRDGRKRIKKGLSTFERDLFTYVRSRFRMYKKSNRNEGLILPASPPGNRQESIFQPESGYFFFRLEIFYLFCRLDVFFLFG